MHARVLALTPVALFVRACSRLRLQHCRRFCRAPSRAHSSLIHPAHTHGGGLYIQSTRLTHPWLHALLTCPLSNVTFSSGCERKSEGEREGGRAGGGERESVCMSEYEREWQRRHLQPWRLSLPGRRRARRGAPRTGACHQSGQASVPLPLGTCHARRSGAHQELARRGRSTRTRAKRAHSLESFPCTGARFNKRHSRVRACVYVRFVCVVWACGHLGVWAGQKARRRASLTTAAAVRPGRISPRPGLRDRTDILSPGPPAR